MAEPSEESGDPVTEKTLRYPAGRGPVERPRRAVASGLRGLDGIADGIVAAVSGGPDSVALLHALIAARPAGMPLVVAHLNHLLRGPESDADATFVAELHARLVEQGTPALSLRVDRRDVKAAGGNVESEARRLRYEWLAEVAGTHHCRWVATGHTADDQAETVSHRLIRGTGLRGIVSLRPLADGIRLVRPLLSVSRADVLAALSGWGESHRHDLSNDDRRLTRNRIRHELLPLLRDYDPRVAPVLGRLAAQAAELATEEGAAAVDLLRQAELPRAARVVVLDRAVLARATDRLRRACLHLIWNREGWPLDGMDFDAWRRLAALVRLGGAADFPGLVRARVLDRVVQLERRARPRRGRERRSFLTPPRAILPARQKSLSGVRLSGGVRKLSVDR